MYLSRQISRFFAKIGTLSVFCLQVSLKTLNFLLKTDSKMPHSKTTIDHENVNGVKLTLRVDSRNSSPKSRIFTISYKNEKSKRSWSKTSLFLAILFNVVAFTYVRINLTAILVIIITFSFLALFWITHSVQSETLLVIPTVGIQSSVKYVCGREDNFIPWSNIDDVIINEVVKMSRVLYFLTVIVKSSNQNESESEAIKLMPLFKYTKPRLVMLEKIYSELQILLMETQRVEHLKASGDQG